MVVEIADEGGDGALEVDVVLPQRIVGIDQQRLAWRELRHEFMVTNRSGYSGSSEKAGSLALRLE